MTPAFVSTRVGWIALAVALIAVLAMQVWAGLALRGLYADGAYYAQQLLFRDAFVVIEPSRLISQVLMQAPVVLAMRLGLNSPGAVALAFSLATNLMPLLLTLASIAVLPPGKRAYGLFPVFVFLAASMGAAVASVADGSAAAAYAWLLFLQVLFGRLTRLRLTGMLLLAAGTLRLHEAMAFLGPILAFACLWRCNSAETRTARAVLLLAALLITLGCAISIHDVLHPRLMANRSSFINDVVSARWLLPGGDQISLMALPGLIAVLALPAALLRPRLMTAAMVGIALIFLLLTILALTEPACPSATFAARNNACLLTAPAMVLLMIMRPRHAPSPAVAVLTAMLGLAITAADATATLGWLGYEGAMRAALASSHGVVAWPDALARLSAPQAEALQRFAWPWTTPLMSLWLSPGPALDAIIANPRSVAWQPFDPYAMQSILASGDAAATRPGFMALLKRDAFARAHACRFRSLSDRAIQTCGDSTFGHRVLSR
jgi:hypothetical protein